MAATCCFSTFRVRSVVPLAALDAGRGGCRPGPTVPTQSRSADRSKASVTAGPPSWPDRL